MQDGAKALSSKMSPGAPKRRLVFENFSVQKIYVGREQHEMSK